MQIKGVQIAGLSGLTVRNMLRRVHRLLDANLVSRQCKVAVPEAKEVIGQLARDGFIAFSEQERGTDYYTVTKKGKKLAQASATTKMPRTRADRIIRDFMKRVKEVNANADYMFRVSTVVLYGSYVRGEQQLSDVDIAVDLEGKWDSTDERQHREWAEERADVAIAQGRSFPTFVDELCWPHREVMLHLKARTRGLSLNPLDDFIAMNKDRNFAYDVLLGDMARVWEQVTRENLVAA